MFNRPVFEWLAIGIITALIGVAAPIAAIVMFAGGKLGGASAAAYSPLIAIGGPLLALGLMGAGMIAAAANGRFWFGTGLALVNGAGLTALAYGLGSALEGELDPAIGSAQDMSVLLHPLSLGLAFVIASISFAARGALFARSGLDKGWLIALFVVAGEAAILITALAMPGMLPDWLLVLLPAQWASIAIQAAINGGGAAESMAVLIALGGTAASTLLVAKLLPRRWPYMIMFTAWLSLSALVWYWPVLFGPVVS